MTSDAAPYIPSGFRGIESASELGGEELRPSEAQSPFRTNGNHVQERNAPCMDGQSIEANCSDESLLEQLREGGHGALAPLFRRYARMVRAVAYRILRDWAEAEDTVAGSLPVYLQQMRPIRCGARACALVDCAGHLPSRNRPPPAPYLSTLLLERGTRRCPPYNRWTDVRHGVLRTLHRGSAGNRDAGQDRGSTLDRSEEDDATLFL